MTKFKTGDRVKHTTPDYWQLGNPTGTIVSVTEPSDPERIYVTVYEVEVDGDTSYGPWKHREKDLVSVWEAQEAPYDEVRGLIEAIRNSRPRQSNEITTAGLIRGLRDAGIRFIREA
jgi:hypothetical protein